MTNPYSTELYHHGIMGMKWGVRRYQNPDGSLTKAGEKRYATNLDVNDTTRTNVAKIRLGEARKRLDTAKINKANGKGDSNNTRIANLRARERSAKSAVRQAKMYDRGAKRAAKGETITGNNIKVYSALGAQALASAGVAKFLNSRMSTLSAQGRWTQGHTAVAKLINDGFGIATSVATIGYAAKKRADNADLRYYNRAQWNGDKSIKRVGSSEYADRKKAANKTK